MKKFTYYITILFTLFICSACQNTSEKIQAEQDNFEQPVLLNCDNILVQEYLIPHDRDTTLKGQSGTILSIEKNTFVDSIGNPISGYIKIEIKECLSKLDMVIGNMTTTYNGEFLESGGMIFINATSNKEQLMIADNKSIGVEVLSDSVLEKMQLFEGVETDNGINWQNPVDLQKDAIKEPENAQVILVEEDLIKQTNVGYYVKDYDYTGNYPNHTFLSEFKDIPAELSQQIGDLCWSGKGITITKDSVVQIGSNEVALIKMDNFQEVQWGNSSENVAAVKGENQFREDKGTSYIFSINKLGWANIDRLFSDPRTKEIELIVTVEQQDEYENIYTSMIFKNQNMYLPGYQKKDNSFSFTHGDYEKTSLPVGETATILVTAYKDNNPFYVIKTFTIKEKQTIVLNLTATTKEDLKIELEKKI